MKTVRLNSSFQSHESARRRRAKRKKRLPHPLPRRPNKPNRNKPSTLSCVLISGVPGRREAIRRTGSDGIGGERRTFLPPNPPKRAASPWKNEENQHTIRTSEVRHP